MDKHKCSYGCGNDAQHLFGNGKWCCEKSFHSCPAERKRISDRMKEKHKDHPKNVLQREIDTGKLKCFLCGKVAISVAITTALGYQPCCSENMMKCPGYSNYIGSIKKELYDSLPQYRDNMSKAMKECQNRPEVKEAKSSAMSVLHTHNEEFKTNYKKGIKKATKTKNTPEYKEECSKRFKEMWSDPEFRTRWVASVTNKTDMNNEETRVYDLLSAMYPGFFSYNVGDKFRVGRLAPDFFNEKHKIAIESFGTFFHTRAMRQKGMTKRQYVADRVKKFKFRGWKLLCIWTFVEFKSPSALTRKITKFMEGK